MKCKPVSMDEFIERSLSTFLEMQRAAYIETMPQDDPEIARVQATYEVANVAFSTIAKFVTASETVLPKPWHAPMGQIHDLICETGDAYLRSKGVEVPT